MSQDLAGHIEDTKLADALSERYIAYAMSTIMARSLPDPDSSHALLFQGR